MLAGPKGEVRARGPLWEEAIVVATIDLADVTRARADMPLIADLETMMPHLRDTLAKVDAGTPHLLAYDGMEALAEIDGRAAPTRQRRDDARRPRATRTAQRVRVVRGDARNGPPPLEHRRRDWWRSGSCASSATRWRAAASSAPSSACRVASIPP